MRSRGPTPAVSDEVAPRFLKEGPSWVGQPPPFSGPVAGRCHMAGGRFIPDDGCLEMRASASKAPHHLLKLQSKKLSVGCYIHVSLSNIQSCVSGATQYTGKTQGGFLLMKEAKPCESLLSLGTDSSGGEASDSPQPEVQRGVCKHSCQLPTHCQLVAAG